MGENRGRDKNESKEEVYRSLKKEFGVDNKQLYRIWLLYSYWIAKGMKKIEVVKKLRDHPDVTPKVLDYFLCLALGVITKEIIKEYEKY